VSILPEGPYEELLFAGTYGVIVLNASSVFDIIIKLNRCCVLESNEVYLAYETNQIPYLPPAM